jgi:hypothetical protein
MALPGVADHVPGGCLFVAGGLLDFLHPQVNRRRNNRSRVPHDGTTGTTASTPLIAFPFKPISEEHPRG